MKVTDDIDLATIQKHLRDTGSGVKLDPSGMPGPMDGHRGFKVLLDADDVRRLILYWEFEKYTRDKSCKVIDLLDSAASLERVKSFIDGNVAKRLPPVDLRTTPKMEPVIVTNDLQGPFLYHIDGNHRVMAHYFSQKSFQDVPALVCAHPKLLEWAYIPMYYKRHRSGRRRGANTWR